MQYYDVSRKKQENIYFMMSIFMRFWMSLKVIGRENIDIAKEMAEGKGIIFAILPHLSYLDVLFVPSILDKEDLPVRYIANSRFFTKKMRKTFYSWGAVPAQAGGFKKSNEGILKASQFIDNGVHVGIFPQGRFPNKKINPLRVRYGVSVIAQETGAPVVPIVLNGTGRMFGSNGDARIIPSHLDWRFYTGLSNISVKILEPRIVAKSNDRLEDKKEQEKLLNILNCAVIECYQKKGI